MYLPKSFNAPEHAWQLVQSHPLGQLISVDPQGLPFLSWLPFHVESQGQADSTGSSGVLLGHLAKANPHVQLLAERPEVTAVFMGPHAYMPTTVYADSLRVPTWSYLVVQMRLKSILVEGEAAKDVLLKQLIGDHQPPALVSGEGVPWDVPMHVITNRPEILASLRAKGFTQGLTPARPHLGQMHEVVPTLLDAFSSSPAAASR